MRLGMVQTPAIVREIGRGHAHRVGATRRRASDAELDCRARLEDRADALGDHREVGRMIPVDEVVRRRSSKSATTAYWWLPSLSPRSGPTRYSRISGIRPGQRRERLGDRRDLLRRSRPSRNTNVTTCRTPRHCSPAYAPPSTGIAAPVTNFAASEHRNAAIAPKSPASPMTPAGTAGAEARRVGVQRLDPLGVVEAGLEGVHRDAVARDLAGQRLEEPGEPGPRGVREDQVRRSAGAPTIDVIATTRPQPLRLHRRHRGLAHRDRATGS